MLAPHMIVPSRAADGATWSALKHCIIIPWSHCNHNKPGTGTFGGLRRYSSARTLPWSPTEDPPLDGDEGPFQEKRGRRHRHIQRPKPASLFRPSSRAATSKPELAGASLSLGTDRRGSATQATRPGRLPVRHRPAAWVRGK
jgi:hypothetical protein